MSVIGLHLPLSKPSVAVVSSRGGPVVDHETGPWLRPPGPVMEWDAVECDRELNSAGRSLGDSYQSGNSHLGERRIRGCRRLLAIAILPRIGR